jgi:acetyl-CoA carboxylase biotin carboxyl carrier protein
VEEGQRVAVGDTLCLIEAMKLFNEILSEHDGIVRTICLEDAGAAEYGQLLFLIDPAT